MVQCSCLNGLMVFFGSDFENSCVDESNVSLSLINSNLNVVVLVSFVVAQLTLASFGFRIKDGEVVLLCHVSKKDSQHRICHSLNMLK